MHRGCCWHKCAVRNSDFQAPPEPKGDGFSPDHIISTAYLQDRHPTTVPRSFTLARQRAAFIGKLVRPEQGQPLSVIRCLLAVIRYPLCGVCYVCGPAQAANLKRAGSQRLYGTTSIYLSMRVVKEHRLAGVFRCQNSLCSKPQMLPPQSMHSVLSSCTIPCGPLLALYPRLGDPLFSAFGAPTSLQFVRLVLLFGNQFGRYFWLFCTSSTCSN
eukprot:365338-Chlamydomonas_euryale.AAC.11